MSGAPNTSNQCKQQTHISSLHSFPSQYPCFPAGGLLSQHLDRLPVGGYMAVEGPLGHMTYEGPGRLRHCGEDVQVEEFLAVAGGTGITPIVQVSR